MAQTGRRSSSESLRASLGKARRSLKKDTTNLFKDGLKWDKYLQICNLPAAPNECFTQTLSEILVNKFRINQKLEAQDPRNPTSICLATVVSLQGPRILLRLDGGDKCNDFWRLVDSGDIYPLGTHEDKGILLQPPLGYTRNVSTWASFLAKNRVKDEKVPKEFFLSEPSPPDRNLFEIGMKLEAVDKKNPDLICPATIGDVKSDQIFVSFDGWRGAMDYWCHYASRDLFPVGWCDDNDHPLSSPGTKGDNPTVVARLKRLADESKRQTRSGSSSQTEPEKLPAGKIYGEMTQPVKSFDQSLHTTSTRGRTKGRITRSLTPVPRRADLDKTRLPPPTGELNATEAPKINLSIAESSADEDTFDSSLSSSQQSSDSYSSEDELQAESDSTQTCDVEDVAKTKPSESQTSTDEITDGEAKKSCKGGVTPKKERVESKRASHEQEHKISEDLEKIKRRRLEKKLRKKRKKDKKKVRKTGSKFQESNDITFHSERKRYASTGDEEHSASRVKKRKKKKRKHSTSSLYDCSPRKRMLGFGIPTSSHGGNVAQPGASIQSPSFLDHATSPTSLFGFSRDEIVKKATEGWPSRLLGGPAKVVTSDNKLARFGSMTMANSSCQTPEANGGTIIKVKTKEIVQGQVTTTTQIEEPNNKGHTGPEISDSENKEVGSSDSISSNVEGMKNISSQTVSSTTHPTQTATPVLDNVATADQSSHGHEDSNNSNQPSAPRKCSRNPQRWSVGDVVNHIHEHEPALASHVQLFRIHEIDGQALLLLNSAIAVKYMNMKLGPALKLANLVERLKQLVPPPQNSL